MTEASIPKCRYLAEFKLFKDFEHESKSNSDFIHFILQHLSCLYNNLSGEIQKRTKETEHMKNRLAKQIRLELIDCITVFNENMVGKIGEVFKKSIDEINQIKLNIAETIKNNNTYFAKNQLFYDFYYQQLKDNMNTIDTLSKQIKQTNKEQIVKTKYFQIQGRSITSLELNSYDLKRNQMGVQILNLQRINERLRADSSTQSQRLDNSYAYLSKNLNQQLQEYQDRLISVFSRLLEEIEPCLGMLKGNSVIESQPHPSVVKPPNIVIDNGSFEPTVYSPKGEPTQDNLHVPTFPGRSSLLYSNQQMDSLFFSKSVNNE